MVGVYTGAECSAAGASLQWSSRLRFCHCLSSRPLLHPGARILSATQIFPLPILNGRAATPARIWLRSPSACLRLRHREAIQRDRAVARHYAAFNLHKARIVELKSPRLVYLSYRLGDKIFWTRKQIKLKEGERIITDGDISARTRCANQVSVLPQTVVSTDEPLPEQLEDPFGVGGSATQIDFPNSIESALLRRTPPGLGEGPGSGFFGPPFGGGGPGIAPPPIPSSCAKPPCSTTPPPPPPPPPLPPPAPVPEPASILLVTSGLAGIYFRYRNRSSN